MDRVKLDGRRRRVDVYYYCRECGRRAKGADGRLCCPSCGGALRIIGTVTRPR
jgi:rubrerythrin